MAVRLCGFMATELFGCETAMRSVRDAITELFDSNKKVAVAEVEAVRLQTRAPCAL